MASPKVIPAHAGTYLQYDAVTGDLHWRVSRGTVRRGSRAGRLRRDGYLSVKLDRSSFAAHRIAWFLYYGEQPPPVLDHADGDKQNNRIANLREATASQNGANVARRSGAAAGKGISCVHGRYRAQITCDGETHYLGSFDTEAEAVAAYAGAAKVLFGDFARVA